MNKFFLIFMFFSVAVIVEAAEVKTMSGLLKTDFCKQLQCQSTSPYKDENGETAVFIKLVKDPLNFDLLLNVNGDQIKKISFKFQSEAGTVDKKILTSLLSGLIGQQPGSAEIDKLATQAELKTTRAQMSAAERIKVGNLSITAGKVLRKPTLHIDL